MTQFDPTIIGGSISEIINNYDGPAPSLIFQAYRGGVSVSSAKGVVDLDHTTPATVEHKFEVASQTKMMTTAILLQLVEEGHFALDDRLADVMDVTPLSWMPNIHEVTLEQLMTHTSGIPDFVNTTEVQEAMEAMLTQDPPQPIGVEEFLRLFQATNLPATSEPGAEASYSNTGFTLLGLLIEHATGRPLADVFQTRIFDPAGMSASSLPGFDLPSGVLRSYIQANDLLLDVTDLPIAEHGEGGVISTTGDMIRFMKALIVDGTLVPEGQKAALDAFFASVSDTAGGEFVGHQGASFGSISMTIVHVPSGTIFSAVETMRYGNTELSDVVLEALAEVLDNPAWHADYPNDGPLDIAATAADLGISEAMGADGAFETTLSMGGVALSLDGRLSNLETEKLSFKDGSTLFVADRSGSAFNLFKDAREAIGADNHLIGLSGDDKLVGGHGDDRLSGNAGDDRLSGNRGDDHLSGGNGHDLVTGGRGDDWLVGGLGDDHLRGGRGKDDLSGGADADILRGGRGNDTLNGGKDNDILIGGQGADTFVFTAHSGDDIIRDFESGKDRIDFTALGLTFEDLQVSEIRGGRAFVVQFDDESLVINTLNGALTDSDFLF